MTTDQEKFIKRAIKYLGCDTARISQHSPYSRLFLIIGFNKNTKTDGKAGQWVKNGKPYDFDYVENHVVASGEDLKELWKSVKFYHRLNTKGWEAFGNPINTLKKIAENCYPMTLIRRGGKK